jgi:hypothetical protein
MEFEKNNGYTLPSIRKVKFKTKKEQPGQWLLFKQ